MNNQIEHLKRLGMNRRDDRKFIIDKAVNILDEQLIKINDFMADKIGDIRNQLEGHEGYCSKVYFETVSNCLPDKYKFTGRSRNPAEDYFNCMLNYCYGILYGEVERACILSGIDPYIGIMHTDNYNKKSMTFDLIEKYRHIADTIVVKLLTTKKVKDSYFDSIEGGYYLNKDGKQLLIGEYNNYMEKTEKHNGRNTKNKNIILDGCRSLANRILSLEVDSNDNMGDV